MTVLRLELDPILTLTVFTVEIYSHTGFPGGSSGKEPTYQSKRLKRPGFYLWARKIPWRRTWQPTPVFLSGKSLGQRSLTGYSA